MNGDIVVRRATVDDYESVINIIDDLWDGDDYLPTLYHVFLQTKKHVFYVAEINGRAVKTKLFPHFYRAPSCASCVRLSVCMSVCHVRGFCRKD